MQTGRFSPHAGTKTLTAVFRRNRLRLTPLAGGTVSIALVLFIVSGCSSGINWRGYSYELVHTRSREENKLTLVYFRSWYRVACTEFEENVLKKPELISATTDLNCVALDFDWDRPLADAWHIREAPAVLIVDPEERVLGVATGQITLETLLEIILEAKRAFSERQPAHVPP